MESTGESFQTYLRDEMEAAGKGFDAARERVFALLSTGSPAASQALTAAAEELAETMRIYTGTIRRLAHFTAHEKLLQEQAASRRPMKSAGGWGNSSRSDSRHASERQA